jgi:tripartite-type tricarboxylate transporter receptor subunit TctC
MKKLAPIAALLAACMGFVPAAQAQSFPSKPITMIVPFAAGGPLDTMGRVLGERMRVSLGQPVINEIVTGAGGSIGFGRVARAAPDGYTFGLGMWSTHVVNGVIYPLPYDVLNDFEPISLLVQNADLIVGKSALPANDLKGLIAWLKDNPGKASWGTQGVGGPSHIGGLLFEKLTGTQVQYVPYRGLAPAMQDLVGGQIDLVLPPPDIALPLIRAGKIKAYAVTAKNRLAAAPEIPTVDEAGLPGFHFSVWTAFWAPKGTPKDVIAKLNAAVQDALADPAVRKKFQDLGQEVFPRDQQTPEALATLQKAEIEKWWPLLKAANIKGQ